MKEFRLTKAQKAKFSNRKQRKEEDRREKEDCERQAHLEWCKEKALKTIRAGDAIGALISFEHNMRAKRATNFHPALFLIPKIRAEYCTTKDIRDFIVGFN